MSLWKALFLISCFAVGLFAAHVDHLVRDAGPLKETKLVLIERGMGVREISRMLEREGVIHSALIFDVLALVYQGRGMLKAGEYDLSAHVTPLDVLDRLIEGRVYERKVTIPEGWTSWQVVDLLSRTKGLKGNTNTAVPAEGSLLPDTYHFSRGDTVETVLKQMSAARAQFWQDVWDKRDFSVPFGSLEEAMILASIVEKETGIAEERGRIAAVFLNRLRLGIPLQSDPTVLYAMTRGKVETAGQGPIGRRLLKKDLTLDSPYNTYQRIGLPPTPIANPGRESIRAVLNPLVSEDLFFVADGAGGHVFARTLEEHNRNVARWRKLRSEQTR